RGRGADLRPGRGAARGARAAGRRARGPAPAVQPLPGPAGGRGPARRAARPPARHRRARARPARPHDRGRGRARARGGGAVRGAAGGRPRPADRHAQGRLHLPDRARGRGGRVRRLFARELRRLAPYGAGGPALGLALLLFEVTASAQHLPDGSLPTQLALGVSALLGVALVAPDTSSGAAAFLARQPLGPGRLLGTRLLAASCWLAVGSLAIAATWALLGLPSVDTGVVPYVPLGFGLGALASTVAHRTLPALLLTPALLVAAVIVAFALPVVGLAILPAGPKTV